MQIPAIGPLFIIAWYVLFLAVVLAFAAVAARGRRRTLTTAESTNRLLFAIVIMLFAVVFKLVSSGMDVVVLVIGLAGLGVGWYGISAGPRE